jgi:hypothetical protein
MPPKLHVHFITDIFSQLVQAIKQLSIAAVDSAYPLKASAQASLALALAHSRDLPAAVEACRLALKLNPRCDRSAALWLLLMSVLKPAQEVMDVAVSLKSLLPNSVLITSIKAGLEVQRSCHCFMSRVDVVLLQASFGLNEQCILSCSLLRLLSQVCLCLLPIRMCYLHRNAACFRGRVATGKRFCGIAKSLSTLPRTWALTAFWGWNPLHLKT